MPNCYATENQKLLLKAALSPRDEAKILWEKYTAKVDLQMVESVELNLFPLIYRAVGDSSSYGLKLCKGKYRHTWCSNHLKLEAVRPIFAKFKDLGVDRIVILKGMAMILGHYKDFGVRLMGDIDILVDRAHVKVIGPYLLAQGWKMNVERFDFNNSHHLDRWHAINFSLGAHENLDLHWSINIEHCKEIDEAVLQNANPFSENVYIPKDEDLLLQTCLHGLKYSPVPLIRWVADAMTLLKNKNLNWDRICHLADKAHVGYAMGKSFDYLAQEFDAPIPKEIRAKLKPKRRLEFLEFQANLRGLFLPGAWFRHCLNHDLTTFSSQLKELPFFLQRTARLKSVWHVPIFSVYWIIKKLLKICTPKLNPGSKPFLKQD